VDGEEFVGGSFDDDLGFTEIFAVLEAGFLGGQFAAGFFDEDASHGLRSGGEEVGAVWPLTLGVPTQTDPCLVHQRGGLQGVIASFTRHLDRGQSTQFVVHHRQQSFRRPKRVGRLGRVGLAWFCWHVDMICSTATKEEGLFEG